MKRCDCAQCRARDAARFAAIVAREPELAERLRTIAAADSTPIGVVLEPIAWDDCGRAVDWNGPR